MRFFVVALLAASVLTVSACDRAGLGNSTAGEGSPATVTPTPVSTTIILNPPLGWIGQLSFRPGSYERAPSNVPNPNAHAASGGLIIRPALYGNYATRFYKGHTLLFADNDEFLVASDVLPVDAAHHIGPADNLVLFRSPKAAQFCWFLRAHEPRQYIVTNPSTAEARATGPTLIEAVDGSLIIVTKVPFCHATP
jgi:hypothetical protein